VWQGPEVGEERTPGVKGRWVAARIAARVVARGLALFFGAFSLANAAVAFRTGSTEDLWWIDLGGAPSWVSATLWLAAGLLVAYGIAPSMARRRRLATACASALLVLAALWNAAGFYAVWRAGEIAPALGVPFSVVVAACFAFLGWAVWRDRAPASRRRIELAGVVAVVIAVAIAFPLAHVWFFGTTDYRRPAEVAVVFGARVLPNGALSTSLEDRVRTAAGLYHDGLVGTIVMSGGVGESGYDETVAMRDRAVLLGVPASAIALDGDGIDTDRTVENTMRMFVEDGTTRVLVVSQFYHLPRIKMAYRAAGLTVYTVPAEASRPIPQTPALVVREIPAFWVYWARAWARGMADR